MKALDSIQADVMKRPYLVIAGTTKAATTSVFAYLNDHPSVSVSNLKETRFFLDSDYPLPSKYRYDSSPNKYGDFFSQPSENIKLWVDATPDYMYSPGTANRIHAALADVRFIFILREPMSRIISWYRFALQNNELDERLTLDEYTRLQLELKNDTVMEKAQHLRAVEEGCYARYLKPYFEIFGREKILVIFLEELSQDPASIMQNLAEFAGIEKDFYKYYEFKIYNKTESMKYTAIYGLYRKFRFTVNQHINRYEHLRVFLKNFKRRIAPFFERINIKDNADVISFSESVYAALKEYYAPANYELSKLLGKKLPW